MTAFQILSYSGKVLTPPDFVLFWQSLDRCRYLSVPNGGPPGGEGRVQFIARKKTPDRLGRYSITILPVSLLYGRPYSDSRAENLICCSPRLSACTSCRHWSAPLISRLTASSTCLITGRRGRSVRWPRSAASSTDAQRAVRLRRQFKQ